jgi:tRNA U38,U39,U40 pseudouridine synthase TruA
VKGKKFLRHMIRRIVGAAFAIASRNTLHEQDIIKALQTQQVNYEFPTAPAQGLLLYEIEYKKLKD